MIYALNVTSQSIDVQIVDDSGLPVTGLLAATFPTLTYSLAGANADVAFPALSDLATITTAWAAGGVKERGNGVYRLDLPNGVFTTAGEIKIRGEATGKHVLAPWIDVAVTVASVANKVAATLAAGDVTGALPADLQTIKTQAVTCGAGVTVGAFVGNATHAIAVDSSGDVTFNNTTIATVTNLTNAPTAGDFTSAMKTSLNAATPTVTVGTNNDKTGYRLATEIRNGTAQAGSTSTTLVLDSGASSTTDFYKGAWLVLTGGSGAGQARLCTAYNGTSKTATVAPPWATTPDATSLFTVVPAGDVLDVQGNVTGNVNGNVGGSVNSVATGVTLAASQHVIVDSGTVTTVTNAVTLPSVPAGWITASGIAASALNGKGDWLLASSYVSPTTALTESTAAVGAAMSEAQLLYEIRSLLAADSVSSGTLSTNTVAGGAKATYTLTLDGNGNPTAIARAT